VHTLPPGRAARMATRTGQSAGLSAAVATLDLIDKEYFEKCRPKSASTPWMPWRRCKCAIPAWAMCVGFGLMIGVEFVKKSRDTRNLRQIARQIVELAFERRPAYPGLGKSVIRIARPCVSRR